MKMRLLPGCAALLLCGLIPALAATAQPGATAPKPETFTVFLYKTGSTAPTTELIKQAEVEVMRTMQGCVLVANTGKSDHVVRVVFSAGGYRVYTDTVPPFQAFTNFVVNSRDPGEAAILQHQHNVLLSTRGTPAPKH